MAAVPSVVYGLWGFFLLQGKMVGVSRWLATYFGWIPIFRVAGVDPRDPLAAQTVVHLLDASSPASSWR